MGYIARRPADEWFAVFYREHYWRLYAGDWLEDEAEESFARCNQILADHQLPPVARCLDVGSGCGGMLRAFRARFPDAEVVGADPATDSIEMCYRRWGFHVEPIDERMRLPETLRRPFDLITCIHVLEHVTDPCGLVTQMRSLLAPGGVLIIEVPDLMSDRWRGEGMFFHIAHLNYFHEHPLRVLMARCGMRVEEIRRGSTLAWPWAIGIRARIGEETMREAVGCDDILKHIARRGRPSWRQRVDRAKGAVASIPLIGPALLAAKRRFRGTGTGREQKRGRS